MAVLTSSLSSHHLSLSLLQFKTPLSLSSKPSLSLSSLRPIHSLSTSQLLPEPEIKDNGENILFNDNYSGDRNEVEEAKENNNNNNNNSGDDDNVKLGEKGRVKIPSLSVKEKKEIGSYAHSLGKKLKSQQVGKGGVTVAVGLALVETLEKNELLKIKIHNNCPGEIDDNVKRLEELTGSVVVGQIGRTVILYRPSMTKLKAEEKKKHAQAVVSRRRQAFKSSFENGGLLPKENGRGRRGSSRYSTSS